MSRAVSFVGSTAVLIAVLLTAGCSAEEVEQPAEAVDVNSLAHNTTEFQAAILADGEVAASEYERAVLAAHDCVVSNGFSPDDPAWQRGELLFGISLTAPNDDQLTELNEKYDKIYTECMSEYASDVATVWVSQMVLTTDERDAMRPDVIACLVSAGLEIGSDAKDDDIYAAMKPEDVDRWDDCAEKFPEFFTTTQGS